MREFSTREVSELTGLTADRVRRWVHLGLIAPEKNSRGHWRYSFQDLAVLRTAGKMLEAQVSTKRMLRTLRRLRAQLPDGRPLSAVRIIVDGERVIVKDRLATWEPESGQGTLDFDLRAPHPEDDIAVRRSKESIASGRRFSGAALSGRARFRTCGMR